ncbi:MAG: DNA translocase FtsK, partial [Clostridia bacterium]|nr:DNA translocase FtsK [Clostridia bacterium]
EPEDEDEMILPEEEKKEQPLATREAERPQSSFGFVSNVAEEEKDEDEDIFAKLAATVNAAPEKPTEGEEDKPAADSEFDAAARELAALLADEKEEPAPVNEPEPEPIPTWTPPPSWTPPRAVAVKAERVAPEPKPEPEPEPPMREYQHPTVDLLNEDTVRKNTDHSEEIAEKIEILRSTLESFHIRVKEQVDCSRGPTITRYELRPEVGVSVRSVMNRIDDISLNLAAPVRIEAPIPGKPAIGVEVPNAVRETVFMRTMLESEAFKNSKKPLDIPLGLGIGGDVQMCNLAAMPHLLVAGTTGSGKSVCINTILLGLIYKCSPVDLRLILIDPKQIEFAPYEHIPHLYMPIVTDMQRAAGALACAVQEMERRYSLIRDVGVRDIDSYNEAVKNDPDREHLPRIVIVIDEFADLKMSCANNDPENFTCRLAQKARAAGIHLIIGTQRPSVDVITGKLKNNIPSRIAFTVMQQVDSRTILDMNGAESLTGKGDMLYMPVGSPKPARVQGAFVSDGELERVVNYVRKNNDPLRYNQAFMDQIEAE